MHTKGTSQLSTSSLVTPQCLVRHYVFSLKDIKNIKKIHLCRVREIAQDDMVWLHLQFWGVLWSLPWNQLCLCCRDHLLVFHKTLQELCSLAWIVKKKQLFSWMISACFCMTFSFPNDWDVKWNYSKSQKRSLILFEKMHGLYGLYQASDIATIKFHTRTRILTPAYWTCNELVCILLLIILEYYSPCLTKVLGWHKLDQYNKKLAKHFGWLINSNPLTLFLQLLFSLSSL